jgi:hypothetical protein
MRPTTISCAKIWHAEELYDLIAKFRYTWPATGEVAKNLAIERTDRAGR